MSDLTADSQEFHRLADRQDNVAAQASQGSGQSRGDFKEKLWETHGIISGPSNNAFSTKADARQDAIGAIEEASITLAAALRAAAAAYQHTDDGSAADLDTQLHR